MCRASQPPTLNCDIIGQLPGRVAALGTGCWLPMDTSQWPALLVFQLAGEECAIPAEAVAQVAPMAALARSPGLPPVLEGFLNVGGAAVPVVRLDRLFGVEAKPPGLYAHLVILKGGGESFALLADRVLDLVRVPQEAFRPLPEGGTFNQCATAELDLNGRTIHMLSPDRLLLEREKQAIAAFRDTAQRYIEELERQVQ